MTEPIKSFSGNIIQGLKKGLQVEKKPGPVDAPHSFDVADISSITDSSICNSSMGERGSTPVNIAVNEAVSPENTESSTHSNLSSGDLAMSMQENKRLPSHITDLDSGRPADIRNFCSNDLLPGQSYRFAKSFTIEQIMSNPVKAKEFETRYLLQEHEYFKQARNPRSGLTYDGLQLDGRTGKSISPRAWSAPSKECLDLAVCIKSLAGNEKAALVVAKGKIGKARKEAARIMEQKIDTYQEFYEKNPGYGGFLPWFMAGDRLIPSRCSPEQLANDKNVDLSIPGDFNSSKNNKLGGLEPSPDWKGEVPGLDNGEFAWTMLLAEHALREQGFTKIADKYKKYLDVMIDHTAKMFYDPEAGLVRGDVRIMDPQSKDSKYETIKNKPGRCDYLTGEHGVHEGMMMVSFVSLFGKGLTNEAVDKVWSRTSMKRVEHESGTTWQAFWGSSHESWAYLFMPLRDVPQYKDLFRIREKIRTQNAAKRGYPGLATSTNKPGEPGYLDGAGIEDIGSQPIRNNHTFAVYGAFPLLLEFSDSKEPNVGQAWLLNILKGPKMQGPLGGGESGTNDGKQFSPLKTIDGTFPNIIAAFGGLEKEMAKTLKHHGKYERFKEIMTREYKEAFGDQPLNEPVGFALPGSSIPTGQQEEYQLFSSNR